MLRPPRRIRVRWPLLLAGVALSHGCVGLGQPETPPKATSSATISPAWQAAPASGPPQRESACLPTRLPAIDEPADAHGDAWVAQASFETIHGVQPSTGARIDEVTPPAPLPWLPEQRGGRNELGAAARGGAGEPLPDALYVAEGPPSAPIDFDTALMMAAGQNPRIAFAQARIAQAFAQYEAARVMWLPSLRAGMNYNKHEGRIQDVAGKNIEVSRGAAYGGLGASAVGAGSPAVNGVAVRVPLTDAIHQPRIQGYTLDARRHESIAALNDQLLETALAYLALLGAHQQRAIALDTLKNGEELAKLTGEFARTGVGTQADADRAAAALALLRNELVRAEEGIAVASARLNQQLSADPNYRLTPLEATVAPIDLVELEAEMTELVALGLSNRPELAASRSLVGEAVSRLRREEQSPWLPSLALGVSYGAFGAGVGGQITDGADRFDFDAAAWWEVRNLGLGERAARDAARAQIQAARLREIETMDLVAREIVEAHAQATARRRQISVAEQGVQAAQQSHARNLERILNGEGLPIEVLQAIQALDAARRDYLRAVLDYDTAQFRLQRALGWPVGEL